MTNVLRNIFGLFLLFLSQYDFTLSAMKSLYIVRTKENNLFTSGKQGYKNESVDKSQIKRQKKLRLINLSCLDYTLLYFQPILSKCCWSKYSKMEMLYKIGNKRVQSEMDIIKIVRKIRNFDVIIKNIVNYAEIK